MSFSRGNIKINSVYQAKGVGEKIFGMQDRLLRKNIFSHMEINYKAEHVHLPIPEYFIHDDEEIDKVSHLFF